MDNFLVYSNFNNSIPVAQMAVYPSFSAVQSLQKVLSTVLLIFVVSSSQSSTQKCGKGTTTTGRYTNCSNDIGCPTWYTCNDQRQCTCSNDRNDAAICDAQSFRSAVLDCNCVTYNVETKSTFAGSCYYNCVKLYIAGYHKTQKN